jgi:hypothetical protein
LVVLKDLGEVVGLLGFLEPVLVGAELVLLAVLERLLECTLLLRVLQLDLLALFLEVIVVLPLDLILLLAEVLLPLLNLLLYSCKIALQLCTLAVSGLHAPPQKLLLTCLICVEGAPHLFCASANLCE